MERVIEFDDEFLVQVKLLSIHYRIPEADVMTVATRLGMGAMDALRIVDAVEYDRDSINDVIRAEAKETHRE